MAKILPPTPALVVIFAIILPAIASTAEAAVDYEVINKAINTVGGNRFNSDIGEGYTIQVLADAAAFIWTAFNESNDEDRKNVSHIKCVIDRPDGISATSDNVIYISGPYIERFSGDVRREFTGLIYHEMTHVWQWDGKGQAPSGLIEGIADYVRLRAGYERPEGQWVRKGGGDRWDQGYDVTARFLDYCAGFDSAFVAKLNARMKESYSDDLFRELLGKNVDQLFAEYKAAYKS